MPSFFPNFYNKQKSFLFLGTILFFFFAFTADTLAANLYWVGPEGGVVSASANYWATSTGGVGGAGVPGASDVAIFDGGGNTSATVSSAWSLTGLQLLTGYGSTLTINNNATTSVNGSITTQAGTLVGPVNMTYAGTFTQTSADLSNLVLFSSGQYARSFSSTGSTTIKSFGISQQYTSTDFSLATGTILIVTDQVTFVQGTFGATPGYIGSLSVRGNLTIGNPNWAVGYYGQIVIDGSGAQAVTGTALNGASLTSAPLVISKPSGTVTFTNLKTSGNIIFNSGIATGTLSWTAGNKTITHSGGDLSGLSLYAYCASACYYDSPATSTINYLQINNTTGVGFNLSTTTVLATTNADLVVGYLNSAAGYVGSLNVRGNLSYNNANWYGGTYGQIVIDGSVDQTITGYRYNNITLGTFPLTISKTGGTLNFTSVTPVGSIYGAYFTGNITFNSATVVTGTLGYGASVKTITNNGADLSGLSLYTLCTNSNCKFSSAATSTIAYLNVTNTGGVGFSLSAGTNLIVSGNVDFMDGAFGPLAGDTGVLYINGNWYYASAWDSGTYGSITISGSGNQIITSYRYSSVTPGTYPVTISKTGGTLNFTSTSTLNGITGAYFTGNITFNSATVVTGTIGWGASSKTITNNGADLSGLSLYTLCTATCNFSSTATSTIAYLNVTNTGGVGFELTANTNLVVSGNVDFLDGAFGTTAGDTGTLYINGNWYYASAWDTGAYGSITISGSGNQIITSYRYSSVTPGTYPITISKTGGTLNFTSTSTLNGITGAYFTGNLTFNSATVVTGTIGWGAGSRTITNNGADLSGLSLYTFCTITCKVSSAATSTIAYLNVTNTSGVGFELTANTNLVVSGNVDFVDGSLGTTAGDTGILHVKGNLTSGAAWDSATAYGQIFVSGTNGQLISTAINIPNLTVINKTTGVATASSTTLLFSNLNVATGTLDMNGKAATITTFAVAASGTVKMLGTEGAMSTPTLNTDSTVWYYGTASAGTIKSWSYKNLVINSASTTNTFTLSTATTTASTTTITSGVLYAGGYNFLTNNIVNDATLRLKGSETLTIANGMDIDSGTIEYVGDGDSVADTYYITSIPTYYNLKINGTDSADIFSGQPATNSQYPPAYSSTYVKATTEYNASYAAYRATDPSLLLTGAWSNSAWAAAGSTVTNQRFHIDLGSAKIIDKVYYENAHHSGTLTDAGPKTFTFWGSNDATAFSTVTYATDTNWTQLTTSISQLVQHPASDSASPQYFNVTNTTPYRYYAFKFANNWGNATYMAIRRIELQNTNAGTLSVLNDANITRGIFTSPINFYLSGDLNYTGGTINATSSTLNLTGTDQAITLSATTTFASLTKTLGVGSTTDQTLSFDNSAASPLIVTGTTTLAGVAGDGLTLLLRSVASGTPWYFDPQGTTTGRVFAYIDVQDSTNLNATEIDSDNITGYVDSGNNIGWGGASAVITVTKSGTQIATTTTPVDNLNLGGAFVLNTTGGNATISSIKIKQAGSVSTTSLTNIRLAYKPQATCSTTTPVDATAFGTAGSFDADNYATTTGSLPLTEGSSVCLYITYDLDGAPGTSTLGRSIDFEITNPSTDVLSADGLASPTTRVNITGRTMVVDPDYVLSMISLHVSDPAKNPTIYYWKDNGVWKREGDGTAIRLTNPNLQVHNLSFTDLTGPNSNGVVRMEITISNMDPGEEGVFLNVTRTLQTTAGVKTRF